MKLLNKIAVITVTASVLLLSACTSVPIKDVDYSITPTTTTTNNKVKDAILKAGKERGWKMRESGSNTILATLNHQGKSLTAKITYDTNHYVVSYVDSTGLNATSEKIHKGYYRWLEFLNRSIQQNID